MSVLPSHGTAKHTAARGSDSVVVGSGAQCGRQHVEASRWFQCTASFGNLGTAVSLISLALTKACEVVLGQATISSMRQETKAQRGYDSSDPEQPMTEPPLERTSPMNNTSSPAAGHTNMDTRKKTDWAVRQDHLCKESLEGHGRVLS